MTLDEFAILASGSYKSLLQDNLHQDPGQFALSLKEKNFSPSVLATQLKYLQKSKSKLPTFFKNNCLFLPKAYEQASSEASAQNRGYTGKACLDLTCGMGVDSLYFSRDFDQVDALEPDPLLFKITQHNFRLMGIPNISLFESRAEDFIQELTRDSYDLIYIDPDRRSAAGKRLIRLDECSPNVVQLYPDLLKISPKVLVKASPMLDLTEARRMFPTLGKLTIVSIKNEIKEILLELGRGENEGPTTEIQILHSDKAEKFSFNLPISSSDMEKRLGSPEGRFLYEPDVAFYKARKTRELFQHYFPDLPGAMNHQEGYFFSNTLLDPSTFPGRVFECIEEVSPQISKLKKYLKQQAIRQIHVSRRHFPETPVKIARKLSVVAGGKEYLLFTELAKRDFRAYHARRIA